MAGQSVGLVNEVRPLREILEQLVAEADGAIAAAEIRLAR
jgi:NAD(P)H-dependent flavin oxidoreductase YrpB (nitropropane dioxygenase family)